MRAEDYLNKRERSVTELREKLTEALEYHLGVLAKEEELSPKDRIELIGRLLPFTINKLAADKEAKGATAQGDPVAGFLRS